MRLAEFLQARWWQPRLGLVSALLVPLSLAYRTALGVRRALYRTGALRASRLPVPVIVVGNLVVGGAGKTPATIALVQSLQAAGWRPGVISRGYGSRHEAARPVYPDDDPRECGDEPLLISRRTCAAVWVGRRRVQAGRALCAAHPEVDIVVADDGLQHLPLHRDAQLIVFDGRGCGNGWLLPAGPLREPLARLPPAGSVVVYNAARASTPWPGDCAARVLAGSAPLAEWWQGAPASLPALLALQPEGEGAAPLLAAAGIAEPQRFFRMLEEHGLRIHPLPLPDHHPWTSVPWAPGHTPVVVTEKDAVKLAPDHPDAARIHVVTLDFKLPAPALSALLAAVPGRARCTSTETSF
ncbi:MAG: tetraacyldisaccharide 4'-kinase [Rubrivivax sp.]